MPLLSAKTIFSERYLKHFKPYPLHEAASNENIPMVKRLLAYLEQQGAEVLHRELHLIDGGPDHGIPITYVRYNYELKIILLEAGSDPGFRDGRGYCVFDVAIVNGHLKAMHLALWFRTDYESILNRFNDKRLGEEVIDWDSRRPGVKAVIDKTIQDANRVNDLLARMDDLITDERYEQVAANYREIANIFAAHLEIEKKIARWSKAVIWEEDHAKAKAILAENLADFSGTVDVTECMKDIPKSLADTYLVPALVNFYQSKAAKYHALAEHFGKLAVGVPFPYTPSSAFAFHGDEKEMVLIRNPLLEDAAL